MSKQRNFAVCALCISGLCAPAARADIFVSNGAGNPNSSQASSYSMYTGAPKLTFTSGLVSSEGVAIGPDGNLYVADGGTGAVLRFNPSSGAFLSTFVAPNSSSKPNGITFGPDNNLYMADAIGVIRQFNGSTGAPMGTFSCGTPAGGACYPFGLAFGFGGNLYVSDLASAAVVELNGSTFAYMGVFIPMLEVSTVALPWGLHFGPNGNLYVVWATILEVQSMFTTGYNVLEFTSSGAEEGFETADTGSIDFAFGPDQQIYTAGASQLLKFSSGSGFLLNSFASGPGLADAQSGFIVYGPGAFSSYLQYNAVDVTPLQTARITVIDGPVRVPPGVPVQALLGFQNSAGVMVGPSQVVSLNPDEGASLDLDASTLISSGRILLQPVVMALPGAAPGAGAGAISGSLEIFTTSNEAGSVFYPGIPVPAMSVISGNSAFVPQGIIRGQSIQINVLAPLDSPCVAVLSFTNLSGNRVGPEEKVNLAPGTMASLNFNANALTAAGRQELLPAILPSNASNPAGGPGVASACLGSVEVYLQKTGAISTYQMASPGPISISPAVAP